MINKSKISLYFYRTTNVKSSSDGKEISK